ncbi:MAG: hypothetical protein QOG79_6913 [Mycobacterium sp.]|jgi:hypothetical protein|nr:hypothetical protein [Mycobacterium sp.]MDT5303591.1 hypothetical protein [Mycobacterium sp.]MDT5352400.1 hypothetical protein [Mycobacterium sp.]
MVISFVFEVVRAGWRDLAGTGRVAQATPVSPA